MSHQATQLAHVVIDIQIKGDVIINFFNLNFFFSRESILKFNVLQNIPKQRLKILSQVIQMVQNAIVFLVQKWSYQNILHVAHDK